MTFDLETERKSGFFSWFHLEPFGEADGQWRCFRPSGPAFQNLVEVDVEVDVEGHIGRVCLGVARAFIEDRRNGVFARDIAKSFLSWAAPKPSRRASVLIATIGQLDQGGAPVIMRGAPPEPPEPDETGGYEVFLGRGETAFLREDGISLTNLPGVLPQGRLFAAERGPGRRYGPSDADGWLRIEARLRSATPEA